MPQKNCCRSKPATAAVTRRDSQTAMATRHVVTSYNHIYQVVIPSPRVEESRGTRRSTDWLLPAQSVTQHVMALTQTTCENLAQQGKYSHLILQLRCIEISRYSWQQWLTDGNPVCAMTQRSSNAPVPRMLKVRKVYYIRHFRL